MKSMTSSETDPNVQMNLSIPQSFRDRLRKEADYQRRTVAEIVRYALEQAFPEDMPTPEDKAREETKGAGALS